MCGSTARSRLLHQQQKQLQQQRRQRHCRQHQEYYERNSNFGLPKLHTQHGMLILFIGLCCQLSVVTNAQSVTPVIGGVCDLGAAEVQIGGKQTQFFLKCEANQESASGKGVWVVKSRNAASPTAIPQPSTTLPPANTEPQQHPKQLRKQPSAAYCAQELNAREADSCTAAVTCLQRNNEDASSFLQCDQSNGRWIKKSCSDGNIFSFEHQACVTNPKVQNRHYARYSAGSQGVVCTFTQCSNSNPCNQGTCNNGYCCTSGSYQSPVIASFSPSSVPAPLPPSSSPVSGASLAPTTTACTAGCPRGYSGCCGTQQASCCLRQQCPGGLPSTGRSCFRSCPSGQVCVSGVCCPQTSNQVAMCPSGGQPYGSCINGYCSPGYQCMQSTGMCCPAAQQSYIQVCPMGGSSMGNCISGTCSQGYTCVKSMNLCCPSTTTNPFVCPDGTQAVGGCINGQCGSGFACVNGLCCNNTSQSPRCLDGSQAVGACINGRCGSGYICTTGNICCPSTALQTCPSGGQSIGSCVNNLCPAGYTCINDQCCPGATAFTCAQNAIVVGPCVNGQCAFGFSCDTTSNNCCPTGAVLEECVNDECPNGYSCYPLLNPTAQRPMCYESCNGDRQLLYHSKAPCQNGLIQVLDHCCTQVRRHRSPEKQSALIASYSEPLPDVLSMNPLGACPNGASAVSGCMNGFCGVGFECINNLCCAYTARNSFTYAGSGFRFNDAEPVGATNSNSTKTPDVGTSTALVSSTTKAVEEQRPVAS